MRTETIKLYVVSLVTLATLSLPLWVRQEVTQPVEIEYVYVSSKPKTFSLPSSPPKIDTQELECLAQNIYHEARGEAPEGMLAVAHVTVNRANHKKFPDTVCEVVKQAKHSVWWRETHGKIVPVRNKCQFSWYCDGKSDAINDQRSWEKSLIVALKVLHGETYDPTAGALYYYNPELADPHWKDSFEQVVMVDNHVFLR